MRKLLCGVLVLLGALWLAPLATAQTVGVPLQVRTGEVYTLSIEGTTTSDMGETDLSANFNYVFAVRILDAEQRLWRYTPVSFSFSFPEGLGPEAPGAENINWSAANEFMSAATRIGTDIGFDCRVDEYGRCLEMTNWPAWSARVENLVLMVDGFLGMIPQTAPIKPDPAAAAKPDQAPAGPDWRTLRPVVLQGFARLIDGIDSHDAGASMAFLYYPAFVQGRTLTRRQDVSFVDELDMPFGAPPLRMTGTLRLDRIDRRANTAIVVRRAAFDARSAQASMGAVIEFVSEAVVQPLAAHLPDGQQPPSSDALAQLLGAMLEGYSYEETTTGVVDLTTGMARETTTDYVVRMGAPGGGNPEQALSGRGRIVTRMTPGEPDRARLPRS